MVNFSCSCGKTYSLDDKFAGRKAKCKACGATIVVPNLSPVEGLEVEPRFKQPPQTFTMPQPIQVAISAADTTRGRQNLKTGFSRSMGCVLGAFAGLVAVLVLSFGGCTILVGGCTAEVNKTIAQAKQQAQKAQEQKEQQLSSITVDDAPLLQSKYFGFQLGASLDSIQSRVPIESSPFNSPEGAQTVQDQYHRLDNDGRSIYLIFFENKLSEITVFMDDNSTEAYQALSEQLTKKYGKPISEVMFGTGACYSHQEHGQNIAIRVMKNYDSLYVVYTYTLLEDLAEQKAKKLVTEKIKNQI